MQALQAELHLVNPFVRRFKAVNPDNLQPEFDLEIRADIGELIDQMHLVHQVLSQCFMTHQVLCKMVADGLDARRYNAPTANDVAAIVPGRDDYDSRHFKHEGCFVRDIVLNPYHGAVQIIDYNHKWTDPLHFVLLFPNGEPGFRPNLHLVRRYDAF